MNLPLHVNELLAGLRSAQTGLSRHVRGTRARASRRQAGPAWAVAHSESAHVVFEKDSKREIYLLMVPERPARARRGRHPPTTRRLALHARRANTPSSRRAGSDPSRSRYWKVIYDHCIQQSAGTNQGRRVAALGNEAARTAGAVARRCHRPQVPPAYSPVQRYRLRACGMKGQARTAERL
jgi:hypothetical protein